MERQTLAAPDRRRFIGGLLVAAAALAAPACASAQAARSVLDAVPAALRAAIANGSVRADLAPYFDRAAREAVSSGMALRVPAGTYTMLTWSPPAGLTVLTDGRATVFRQLDTRGRGQRFIVVSADGVRLWPGGAATIDGGMTARGTNATGFNSGVYVYAGPGARIGRFECGDVYGRNLGGDVVETGCDARGFLGSCTIGTIYGDNVYRNCLSVTSGAAGTVAGVIQTGGCGLYTADFEPDPTSAPIGSWTVGTVRGHRLGVGGAPAVGIGSVTIRDLDLDRARPSSIPPLDGGGVSERKTPSLFNVGIRYAGVGTLRVDRASIRGFSRAAIEDITERPQDRVSGQVSFGSLTIANCGSATNYQVITHKTRQFAVDTIEASTKSSPAIATFLGGDAMTAFTVRGGRVSGRVVSQSLGSFEASGLTISGAGQPAFQNVRGRMRLSNSKAAGASVLIADSPGSIDVESSDVTGGLLSSGSNGIRLRASRVNGRAAG
ncbi:hypothetical protein ACOYW6_10655 [Parablastomonas sp. CN1-191]|uniref:hypothetical protein n=1 Tax=Parablastomonas sp. CN1-191 TaxID=3400908 RepID=UPI003BF8D9B2